MRGFGLLTLGAALAGLSACGPSDANPKPGEPVLAQAAASLRPGLWTVTARSDDQEDVREVCIEPEKASLEALVAEEYAANPACASEARPALPGQLSAAFVCRSEEGTVRAQFTGSHTADTFSSTTVMTVEGGGQTNSLTIRASGRRIGDVCPVADN